MQKKIAVLFLSLALLVGSVFILTPQSAYAQNTKAWAGDCVDAENPDVATIRGVECLVGNFLNIGVTAVGLGAFVMFLVGSFLYLTSGGNPKGTEAGQKTITFAIIGVVVSVMGFIVLNFVTDFTGVQSIKTFTLDGEPRTN